MKREEQSAIPIKKKSPAEPNYLIRRSMRLVLWNERKAKEKKKLAEENDKRMKKGGKNREAKLESERRK